MAVNMSRMYGAAYPLSRLVDQEDGVSYPVPEEVGSSYFPPLQMVEDDEAVYVRVSIPGVSLDRVSLEFGGGRLVVQGNLPAPVGLQHRVERPSGPFRRSVKIPCSVMGDRIRAVMRNGLLVVTMPKPEQRQENKAKRSIPVTCSQVLRNE